MTTPANASSSSASSSPLLLLPLRQALGGLYSFGSESGSFHREASHEWLMQFQCRNARRKRRSHFQKQVDREKARQSSSSSKGGGGMDGMADKDDDGDDDDDDDDEDDDNDDNGMGTMTRKGRRLLPTYSGSAWMTCVTLLLMPKETTRREERLFCAQSLLHRLRRCKLSEACDVEVEEGTRAMDALLQGQGWNLFELCGRWCHSIATTSGASASGLLWNLLSQHLSPHAAEDDLKGQLTLLTLGFLLQYHSTTAPHHQQQHENEEGPLISTLASALAVTALRVQFAMRTSNASSGSTTLPSLVSLVVESTSKGGVVLGKRKEEEEAPIFSALQALPDTLLGSEGGARGRLSMDRNALQQASLELRSTGIRNVTHTLQSHFTGTSSTMILLTCEKWAAFVPLPMDFIQGTVPVAAQCLQQEASSETAPFTAAVKYLQAIWEGACQSVDQILSDSVGMRQYHGNPTRHSNNNNNNQSMGGSSDATPKRKQGNKSKKRYKERLEQAIQSTTSSDLQGDARDELQQRKWAACRTAQLAWEALQQVTAKAIGASSSSSTAAAVVACCCTCATACLPVLLTQPDSSQELFHSILDTVCHLCGSSNRQDEEQGRAFRALTYEPLMALSAALAESASVNPTMEHMAVEGIFQCVMNLASQCAYPRGYFEDLTLDNDEELEVERNDVRDVLRSVCGSEAASGDGFGLPLASLAILEKLVQTCHDAIHQHPNSQELAPEPAVHTLSALAKPVNRLSQWMATTTTTTTASPTHATATQLTRANGILHWVLSAMATLHSQILHLVGQFPPQQALAPHHRAFEHVLPTTRLAALATASYAPTFGVLGVLARYNNADFCQLARHTLAVCARACALSVQYLPELVAPSRLLLAATDGGGAVYDIRGAMRGPGGEDHVGCIALMRLTTTSSSQGANPGGTTKDADTALSQELLEASSAVAEESHGRYPSSLILHLCDIHDGLKQLELQRGPQVHHGVGVTPKSRRILISVISRLGLVAAASAAADSSTTPAVQVRLQTLFQGPLNILWQAKAANGSGAAAEMLFYQLCEAVFDMAAFSSTFTRDLFASMNAPNSSLSSSSSSSTATQAMTFLVDCALSGYRAVEPPPDATTTTTTTTPFSTINVAIQWGRLRGGMLALLRSSVVQEMGLEPAAMEIAVAMTLAECKAMTVVCSALAPPSNASNIFVNAVVGEEIVPAGALVMLLGETLESLLLGGRHCQVCQTCVEGLSRCKDAVLRAILLPTPEATTFVDPRPTVAEAWFLAVMAAVPLLVAKDGGSGGHAKMAMLLDAMLRDTVCASIQIMLCRRPPMEQGTTTAIQGLSVDGPQTLVMMDMLEAIVASPRFFSHELVPLAQEWEAIMRAQGATLVIADEAAHATTTNAAHCMGLALLSAALFRSASGGLPPWAIERVPNVFCAMYIALEAQFVHTDSTAAAVVDKFMSILQLACALQLSPTGGGFGAVRPGEFLVGRTLHKVRGNFLPKVREDLSRSTVGQDTWRKFKVLLKKACGGKKKDAGFNLKPALTQWECDRI